MAAIVVMRGLRTVGAQTRERATDGNGSIVDEDPGRQVRGAVRCMAGV